MKKVWRDKFTNFEFNNLYPLFFTIIFILILIQYSFSSLDALFYDLWVKNDLGAKSYNEIVVVTLDEESDQFLGEIYPYTYATHSRFIERILKDSPVILNYFIPFMEPESEDEKKYLFNFHEHIQKFKQKGGLFHFGTDKDAWGELIPPDNLADLGYSLGILNRDGTTFAKDNVTRRAILNISGEDSLHMWTAIKFREQLGLSRKESSAYKGAYYDRETDATYSLFRYTKNPTISEQFETIPFHRVVVGNFPKNYFKNKIVLVGGQYLSNAGDFVLTPFGKEENKAAKIYVHAQIIDSLINELTIYKIPDWVSDFLSILIAIFLSFIISKVQPTKGLIVTILLMISFFILSFALFNIFGVWFQLSHVILSIFVVYYIWVPFRAIGEYQTRFAIQEEAKMLKKVDNLKQNFISLMSHDLKTPVAKIAGIADILRNQYEISNEQKSLLDKIVGSTKDLNDFITSILDLTKIESRNLSLNIENKDVNVLLESSIEKLKFEASSNQISIEKDLSPLYPIKIDQVLINRVFANIIGNAIKYAGQGSYIKVKTWDDDVWVYIEISDNGVGINAEELDNIFEKFYRVKNDSSHQIKGSGLGLYLVKYFVELHNGFINVTSKLNEGTTFLIKLKNE